MKQLIARIDDELHARLKDQADAEGRSMNALVIEILQRALRIEDEQSLLRDRLQRRGLLHEPSSPDEPVPTLDEVLDANRGTGTAVSEALEAERHAR